MTALSTHDTKRGEDVRARIGVLSQVPSLWAEFVSAWERRHAVARRDDRTVPVAEHLRRVARRRQSSPTSCATACTHYAEKAIREAAVHTTWNDPDAEFEAAVHAWIDDRDRRADRHRADRARRHGSTSTPAATASARSSLALTAPGVPDVYQGTELWDDSLVDPDNRRPVDYRRAARGAVGR